jgi:hypothetical protein
MGMSNFDCPTATVHDPIVIRNSKAQDSPDLNVRISIVSSQL